MSNPIGIPRLPKCEDAQCNLPAGHLGEHQQRRPYFRPGAELIAAERQRQMTVEGWTPEHDDAHEGAELLQAALWYLDNGADFNFGLNLPPWPWEQSWWKPSEDAVRQLVKAGALIAAEIDRIQRRGK